MGFGKTIRRRRQSLALSLRKAAKLLGCDAAYLSRIESGKTVASDELIIKLARVLATDEQELFLAAGRLPASLRPLVTEQSHEVMMALKDTLNAALEHACQSVTPPLARPGMPRAIDDGFPFEAVSDIAEAESWRKEIYRPIYHVHK